MYVQCSAVQYILIHVTIMRVRILLIFQLMLITTILYFGKLIYLGMVLVLVMVTRMPSSVGENLLKNYKTAEVILQSKNELITKPTNGAMTKMQEEQK